MYKSNDDSDFEYLALYNNSVSIVLNLGIQLGCVLRSPLALDLNVQEDMLRFSMTVHLQEAPDLRII